MENPIFDFFKMNSDDFMQILVYLIYIIFRYCNIYKFQFLNSIKYESRPRENPILDLHSSVFF